MNKNTVLSEIREFCHQNADEETARKYLRYFREGFKSYGVPQVKLDAKLKDLAGREGMTLSFIMDLADELIPPNWYEEVALLMLLLEKKKKQFTESTFGQLDSWFAMGIENWAHTDFMGSRIMDAFLQQDIIRPESLQPWMASDRKYQRRVVPVSLIKYMKKRGGVEELIILLEPLMADRERVVHQGIGWFLREAWKQEPLLIESFLLKYRNTAARLIFQYATEKMSKEERLRFRRDKVKVIQGLDRKR